MNSFCAQLGKVLIAGKTLLPCRSKCRLVGESVTEWRDELINVKHATGMHGLIGEIQIVRSKMLLQRETMECMMATMNPEAFEGCTMRRWWTHN